MISIVIPTYNERENIRGLIDRIEKALGRVSHEILFVDDQSPDGTVEAVERLARKKPRIRLLSHPPPRDLGRSILMGVEAARGDVVVGMDGDGNHDPRYIPQFLNTLQKADLVVGSRFIRREIPNPKHQIPNKSKFSKFQIQNIGSLLFNAMLKYCFGFPVWDNTSGFYAIRRKTLAVLDPPSIYYGYGEYHLRLVYKVMEQRLRIIEVPVVYPPRIHGQSKSRLFIMLGTYVKTVLMLKNEKYLVTRKRT